MQRQTTDKNLSSRWKSKQRPSLHYLDAKNIKPSEFIILGRTEYFLSKKFVVQGDDMYD